MSTTTKALFCEGVAGGEAVLFTRIAEGTGAAVRPAGGKEGMQAFAQGMLTGTDARRLYIRDRDFDEIPDDQPKLKSLPDRPSVKLLHRTCIENYFLDSAVIRECWSALRGFEPTPSLEDINEWLKEAARQITDYQAVRYGLAALIPRGPWPKGGDFESPSTRPSLLNFDSCMMHVENSLDDYKRQHCTIDIDAVRRKIDVFRGRFQTPDFVANSEFKIWFSGKELLMLMADIANRAFPLHQLRKRAFDNLEWRQFPDLVELHIKLRSL